MQLESQELIPGPSSPPPAASGSLLSSAASLAAAAGRRATSTASPASSPAKNTAANDDGPRKEVNCVEGYDKNVYIGRSDGVVEWWVLDGNSGDDKVSDFSLIPWNHELICSTTDGLSGISIPCFHGVVSTK